VHSALTADEILASEYDVLPVSEGVASLRRNFPLLRSFDIVPEVEASEAFEEIQMKRRRMTALEY
jgi:hypothetical protein